MTNTSRSLLDRIGVHEVLKIVPILVAIGMAESALVVFLFIHGVPYQKTVDVFITIIDTAILTPVSFIMLIETGRNFIVGPIKGEYEKVHSMSARQRLSREGNLQHRTIRFVAEAYGYDLDW